MIAIQIWNAMHSNKLMIGERHKFYMGLLIFSIAFQFVDIIFININICVIYDITYNNM